MRKLSEIKDREAFRVMARLIKPIKVLASDAEFIKLLGDKKLLDAADVMLNKDDNIDALIEIMAALDGVPKEEYHVSLIEIPSLLLSLVNDEDLMAFFQ